jgi:hypothetical protein
MYHARQTLHLKHDRGIGRAKYRTAHVMARLLAPMNVSMEDRHRFIPPAKVPLSPPTFSPRVLNDLTRLHDNH